jgi:ribosomal protein L34
VNEAGGVKEARWQESTWRVLRGGSWNNNDRDNLLSSYRNNNDPDNRNNNNGFRVVVAVGSGRKVINNLKNRRDLRRLFAFATEPIGYLTHRPSPRKKSRIAGTGEKTRKAGCCGTPAAPGLAPVEAFKPTAHHPARLIKLADYVDELLARDPATLMCQPPKDAKFFQHKIKPDEGAVLLRPWRVGRFNAKLKGVERKPIKALAESESLRLW